MGKLILTEFVSLDGIMQAPGGKTEDPSGGFQHEGWTVPYSDERFGAFMGGVLARTSALLLGRKTYEIFASHWPHITDPSDQGAATLNSVPKHVATKTLETVSWNNSSIVRDPVAALPELKKRYEGELQVFGSSNLAQTLLATELVDELNVLTFPVLLGSGKRLFGPGVMPLALELFTHVTSSTGVQIQQYRRVGKPTYGSFLLESRKT